jgi:hypothetical protein
MANDLGFHDVEELLNFAFNNIPIWGNNYGGCMFGATARAYNDASNLSEVIEYLKGVRDRSPE